MSELAGFEQSQSGAADAPQTVQLGEAEQQRFDLMLQDLEEVVGRDDIAALLRDGKEPHIYWGTATTGKPHFGYFLPMMKVGDFLKAGCKVTILFADLHACLDHEKTDWAEVNNRVIWYKFIITEMLKRVGVPLEKLHFITGSDYQLSREYTFDVYKSTTISTYNDCLRAGAEVVKTAANPLMSGLLYPILQALDEQYLDVDIQFGGVDQRKIFMLARDLLPRLGYRKRAHLMNPLIPALTQDGKMSASNKASRLDFDDSPKVIQGKIQAAFAEEGKVEGNGMLALFRYVLFRYLDSEGKPFRIERDAKWGGPVEYKSHAELCDAWAKKELSAPDLKMGLTKLLVEFLAPLREVISHNLDKMHAAYKPDPSDDPAAIARAKKAAARQGKGGAAAAAPASSGFGAMKVVVGQVKSVRKHENADTLYVEEIDVGEAAPRTVVSGLVPYMTADELLGRKLLVCMNLAPADLKGIQSFGMVLAAKAGDPKDQASIKVQLVSPPEGAAIGAVVSCPSDPAGTTPDEPTISKARVGKILKLLTTNADGVVCFKNTPLKVDGADAPITGLPNAVVN